MGQTAITSHAPTAMFDLERVLDRLPASLRAKVAWTRPTVRHVLARLRTEPLTDELVTSCAGEYIAPVLAISSTLVQHMSPVELTAMAQDSASMLRADLAKATDVDPETLDTFDWCVSIVHEIHRTFSALMMDVDLAAISAPPTQAQIAELATPPLRGLITGQVLLAAAAGLAGDAASAGRGVDGERMAELVDRAFLALTEATDDLRRVGMRIEPFGDDTTAQRGQRILRAALHVRESLGQAPEHLDSSRLRTLR